MINQIIITTDITTMASQDDEGAVKVLQYAKQIREKTFDFFDALIL
jgi:hypothetical protein